MKNAGWIVAVIAALGLGFFLRGFIPSKGAAAGGGAPAGYGAAQAPAVRVMETALEKANPVVEYIARVEPIQQVSIMAQVEGTIEAVHFREGSRVAKGDLLFTLDPAPYAVSLAEKTADLEQAKASLDRSEKYLAMLHAADNRSVSKSDLDSAEANVAEGRALVQKSSAAVQQAEIDLGYTQIKSPIDGRIGRALITRGNLVSPSSGALASVIQIDPIRVVIAMPDTEYLPAFERYSNDETYNPEVTVRLANGEIFPGTGEIDFDDNQMNPATGTIDIHLRFANPQRLLVPNNFVTARVRDGNSPMKIFVPAESVMHDTDGTFVWTVAEDNTVAPARVETGAMVGTRQIIESGLEAGQRVVYAGMQKIRPGMAVTPMEAAKSE